MKKSVLTLALALASLSPLTTPASFADVTLTQSGQGWKATDTGNYQIRVDITENGSGNIRYAGGDLINSWAYMSWNLSAGETYMSVSKNIRVGSSGYPKLVDELYVSRYVYYETRVDSHSNNNWQTGMYLWLNNGTTALPTHELNVWNYRNNTSGVVSGSTFIGDYYADGATYKVYKRWNPAGFYSWYIVRQGNKTGMNMDVRALLRWLRERGLPNIYLVGIMPCTEAGPGWGNVYFRAISIPNL